MEWISVEDRLPEPMQEVLVFDGDDLVFVRLWSWDDGESHWYDSYGAIDSCGSNITHWMPLPEPPKGE